MEEVEKAYYRPMPCDPAAAGALRLAGGGLHFASAERITRRGRRIVPAGDIPPDKLARLTAPRPRLCGLDLARPRLMGILNVTPDSFSDGGLHVRPEDALARAEAMRAEGADLIDIGGESTRPGAEDVPEAEELRRTIPVIRALRAAGFAAPISIDTRKASVARAAAEAGADLFNDVSALTFDAESLAFARASGLPVILMHAQGDPKTMQADPRYEDVLLDVYDWLEARIAACEAAGIPRARLMVDPGIGFGKTLAHNLALIRGLSLFHGLGCPVLLGVSRKGFIGALTGVREAGQRLGGSVAAGLAGLDQGAQILRVHDVGVTKQAIDVWLALNEGRT
ncbi:MAG TPA: dihydropteroate synthase [Paracoccaceae bacterium]|nr:dihydropteroate synthase [Paracoccaceae bacterium]